MAKLETAIEPITEEVASINRLVPVDLDSSDRAAYLESLELIRELDFDILVPWAATAGQPHHPVVGHAAARRRVDAIIERRRRGEDR